MKLTKEFKVALLAIVAIAALYFGYNFLRGSNLFSSKNTFYVIYDNVEGLNVSAPVNLNGMAVGLVKSMVILQDQNNKIKVALEVEKEIGIGDSSIAILVSSDLLGGKAIELYLGASSRLLEDGEVMKGRLKQSLTDILAAKAMPIAGRLDSTMARLNSLFDEDAQRRIRAIIANTEASSLPAKNLMETNQQNINRITDNMSALSSSLRVTEAKFGRVAGNLNQFTDSLKQADVNEMVRHMNATITEAQTAIAKFNEDSGTLGKLINNDSLYNNLNTSTASLDALLKDMKANPKRYVHFSVFGGKTKVEDAKNVKQAVKVDKAENVEQTKSLEEVKN